MKRRVSNQLRVGRVAIGGGAPVSVQSMTNTRTSDADATLAQIRELAALGCDIIRCAVPDMPSAETADVKTDGAETQAKPEAADETAGE